MIFNSARTHCFQSFPQTSGNHLGVTSHVQSVPLTVPRNKSWTDIYLNHLMRVRSDSQAYKKSSVCFTFPSFLSPRRTLRSQFESQLYSYSVWLALMSRWIYKTNTVSSVASSSLQLASLKNRWCCLIHELSWVSIPTSERKHTQAVWVGRLGFEKMLGLEVQGCLQTEGSGSEPIKGGSHRSWNELRWNHGWGNSCSQGLVQCDLYDRANRDGCSKLHNVLRKDVTIPASCVWTYDRFLTYHPSQKITWCLCMLVWTILCFPAAP